MEEIQLLLEDPQPDQLLIFLCGLFGLIQLYFLIFIHGKLALHKVRSIPEDVDQQILPPISVIICTRNEESLLRSNLPAILEQDYPNFEVVVVNDRSEDDSKWVLQDLASTYERLKVSEIAEHVLSQVGKKFGVAMGIKAAQNEHLIFTDVACIPNSNQWLRHMAQSFSPGKEIILGYAPMVKEKGLKNIFLRFEHDFISLNYLSFALAKKTYMGLGQNMAYVKSLFYKGKGFASHIHIRSGYDALFVNQHATTKNVNICIHSASHVWKPVPQKGLQEMVYKDQRLAISTFFRGSHKRMLNTQALSALLFYLCIFASLIIFPSTWKWIVGIYGVRMMIQLLIYIPIAKKLNFKEILWMLPLFDMVQSFSRGWNVLFGKSKLYANG